MKPKRWNKRRICRLDVTIGTIRSTMWRSNVYCVDTRLNYLNPNLSQRSSIMLPMLSPMGGWTLNMMIIHYIRWGSRAVYLRLFLMINYITSWLYTCKVRLLQRILVTRLWSWNNHGLNYFWRTFSLFFTQINRIFVVPYQRRRRINSPIVSKSWRRSTISMERMRFTRRITGLDRYPLGWSNEYIQPMESITVSTEALIQWNKWFSDRNKYIPDQ